MNLETVRGRSTCRWTHAPTLLARSHLHGHLQSDSAPLAIASPLLQRPATRCTFGCHSRLSPVRVELHVHALHQGLCAGAGPERLHGQVGTDQGGGAGRVLVSGGSSFEAKTPRTRMGLGNRRRRRPERQNRGAPKLRHSIGADGGGERRPCVGRGWSSLSHHDIGEVNGGDPYKDASTA